MKNKTLIYLLGLPLSFVVIFLLLSFTALPIDIALSTLAEGGSHKFSVGSTSGNIFRGFNIKNISKTSLHRSFILNELDLSYKTIFDLPISNKLEITNFSIESLKFQYSFQECFTKNLILFSLDPQSAKTRSPRKVSKALKRLTIKLDKFYITNSILKIPELDLLLKIDQILIKNLTLKEGTATWETLKAKGNALEFNSVKPESKNGLSPGFIRGFLLPDFFQGLKNPVPFSGNFNFIEGKISFNFEAFQGQIALFSDKDDLVHLVFKNFQPNQFLKKPFPVTKIDADLILGYAHRLDRRDMFLDYGQFDWDKETFKIIPEIGFKQLESENSSETRYEVFIDGVSQSSGKHKKVRWITGVSYNGHNAQTYYQLKPLPK